MKNVTLPPGGKVESYTVYEAVNVSDSSDRFKVIADTELHAKLELIDKLGYTVKATTPSTAFVLVDAETEVFKAHLASRTLEAAVDEVLKAARWKIQEPMEMVGGTMGSGFNEVEFDDE
jgi:hypothetical protein